MKYNSKTAKIIFGVVLVLAGLSFLYVKVKHKILYRAVIVQKSAKNSLF